MIFLSLIQLMREMVCEEILVRETILEELVENMILFETDFSEPALSQ